NDIDNRRREVARHPAGSALDLDAGVEFTLGQAEARGDHEKDQQQKDAIDHTGHLQVDLGAVLPAGEFHCPVSTASRTWVISCRTSAATTSLTVRQLPSRLARIKTRKRPASPALATSCRAMSINSVNVTTLELMTISPLRGTLMTSASSDWSCVPLSCGSGISSRCALETWFTVMKKIRSRNVTSIIGVMLISSLLP